MKSFSKVLAALRGRRGARGDGVCQRGVCGYAGRCYCLGRVDGGYDIEAIIDDSGSMEVTDPNKLRIQVMDLLVKTFPGAMTLGAVEFGSGFEGIPGVLEGTLAASTLFPPEEIGPNAAAMEASMKANVNADNWATDYNGGVRESGCR